MIPNKDELIQLAKWAKGSIHHIYLHHTGGTYEMNAIEKKDYHICIEGDGTVRLNGNLDATKTHTWKRNTGSVGVAICCGWGAIIQKDENIVWGNYPPKTVQIETMAEVVAILCKYLELPIDRLHVLTHDEVAVIDNYDIHSSDPDCRWDLRWLADPGTHEQHKRGGDVIRGLAIWKLNHEEL